MKRIMVDAKKFEVPDIKPSGFIIEILDSEQKPVAGMKFSVAIDDRDAKSMETDERGILRLMPMPKNEINLSLAKVEEEV